MRVAVVVLALLLGCMPRARVVTAAKLLQDPARFDGAHVVIAGRVVDLRMRAPEQGNAYTSFLLADGTARLSVFGWGKLDVDPGDLVEVRGEFHSLAHAGSDTLPDTLEASFVRRVAHGPQLPGPIGPP